MPRARVSPLPTFGAPSTLGANERRSPSDQGRLKPPLTNYRGGATLQRLYVGRIFNHEAEIIRHHRRHIGRHGQ